MPSDRKTARDLRCPRDGQICESARCADHGCEMVEPKAGPQRPDDVAARLRAACVGHPAAKISWPHRLLHEGADEIERLRLLLHRCLCAMDADYHALLIKDINDAGVVHVCSPSPSPSA